METIPIFIFVYMILGIVTASSFQPEFEGKKNEFGMLAACFLFWPILWLLGILKGIVALLKGFIQVLDAMFRG